MRKTAGRPKALPDNTVLVQASVPEEVGAALDAMVALTRTSKATFIRRALADALIADGYLASAVVPSSPAQKHSPVPNKKEN